MGKIRVTRDQAAAIPYASLGYSLDDGNQSILVLATDTNGELLWTSPSHIVIVTRNGRIVRTLGFAHDLSGLTTPGGPPPARSRRPPALHQHTGKKIFRNWVCMASPSPAARAWWGGKRSPSWVRRSPQTASMKPARAARPTGLSRTVSGSIPTAAWSGGRASISHPKAGVIETEILRPPG